MIKGKAEYIEARKTLPIFNYRDEIIQSVRNNQITLVIGETGCGKTTQVCQYLYDCGLTGNGKAIVCTQPRRVAAVTVSKRVADEQGVDLGGRVGYKVRFDEKCGKETKIKFVTDGMLLREAISDRYLHQYSVVMLDEAHERSLHTDILLGLLKTIITKRPDLKVLIMSATINAEIFSKFYGSVNVLNVKGRMYPVTVMYTEIPQDDYIHSTATTIINIHMAQPVGDILVFMTGQEEIEALNCLLLDYSRFFNKELVDTDQEGEVKRGLIDNIYTVVADDDTTNQPSSKRVKTDNSSLVEQVSEDGVDETRDLEFMKMIVRPIYSSMPTEKQLLVFEGTPGGFRKIILATNIAETSLTISGVKYVVDTGFVKLKNINKRTGIEALELHAVSKAQARQRTGRAGRESSGICYRLYTESAFDKLADYTVPEILRSSLSITVLQLKALGIDDIINFDFIDKPEPVALKRAMLELLALGALDRNQKGKLTPLGKQMALVPVDPKLAKVLIVSGNKACSNEIIDVISLLTVPNLFFVPFAKRDLVNKSRKKFIAVQGDHLTYLNVLKQYRQFYKDSKWCSDNFINTKSFKQVYEVRKQLLSLCETLSIPVLSCGVDTDKILKCLLHGFFQNIAEIQDDGTYKTIHDNQIVVIHPSSTLKGHKPAVVLYNEIITTKKKYIRDCSVVSLDWVQEAAPNSYLKITLPSSNINEDKDMGGDRLAPLLTPAIKKLEACFKSNGFEIRFVGGLVRDLLLGKTPKDIDLSTDANPQQMITMFQKNNVKYIETGLQHGTLTCILNNTHYEITSLRVDAESFGRHAEVLFVNDWKLDAERRDLTVNAMSLGFDGTLYDFFNGQSHLEKGAVIFVGDPRLRIKEDYLRILRYFRFHGVISNTNDHDKETLMAIKENAEGLGQISGERISAEMLKIFKMRRNHHLLTLMTQLNVTQHIHLKCINTKNYELFHRLSRSANNPITILMAIMERKEDFNEIIHHWKLSNTQKALGNFILTHRDNPSIDFKTLTDLLVLGAKLDNITELCHYKEIDQFVPRLVAYDVPIFPIDGLILTSHSGIKPSKQLGEVLQKLKQHWIDSHYMLTKTELLTMIKPIN